MSCLLWRRRVCVCVCRINSDSKWNETKMCTFGNICQRLFRGDPDFYKASHHISSLLHLSSLLFSSCHPFKLGQPATPPQPPQPPIASRFSPLCLLFFPLSWTVWGWSAGLCAQTGFLRRTPPPCTTNTPLPLTKVTSLVNFLQNPHVRLRVTPSSLTSLCPVPTLRP